MEGNIRFRYFTNERIDLMISINKDEARAMREALPTAHIVRTMKQKSKRGHYFCEEAPKVIVWLEEYRRSNIINAKRAD